MKKIILSSFIFITLVSVASAQVQDFLPENSIGIDYSASSYSYDKIYVDGSKTTVLKSELKKNDLEKEDVSGDIEYTTMTHQLNFRYGISNTLNAGVGVPYIYRKRSSDLSDADQQNASFVTQYQSAETSGMGDYSVWLMWRAFYTDAHNLQLGLKFKDNTGAYHYDKNDELALGNGTQDLTASMKWFVYSFSSTLRGCFDLFLTYSLDDVTQDATGDNVKIERDSSQKVKLGIYEYFGALYYQTSINYINNANTLIDGESQEDGDKGFYFDVAVGASNLDKLEKGSVGLPWEVEVGLRYNLGGTHLPATYAIGVNGSVYF